MVTVNITVTDEAVQPEIYLGRQGEKQAREIVFDLSALTAKYGAGTATLCHQRSRDTAPYVVGESTGDTLAWVISDTDTAFPGIGFCEFRYTFGSDSLSKSTMFATNVKESLNDDIVVPEPLQSYFDKMMDYIKSRGNAGAGMTSDVISALLDCFAHVAWIDEDGRTYYDALENALQDIYWDVSNILTHCVSSNPATSITKGAQYLATITPSTGYTLDGAAVSVEMGGIDITSDVYSNGVINIPAVTGSLTISVSAELIPVTIESIEAVYTQSGAVYDTDALDSLKTDLVVTVTYSDSSTQTVPAADYTLSGTLTEGTSTITVSYGGKTATFTVTVTAAPTLSSISAVYTQSGTVYENDSIDSLKSDLVVTAIYSDSSTEIVTTYTLSGTLTEGTSIITVSYDGKTTTFDVVVDRPQEISLLSNEAKYSDSSFVNPISMTWAGKDVVPISIVSDRANFTSILSGRTITKIKTKIYTGGVITIGAVDLSKHGTSGYTMRSPQTISVSSGVVEIELPTPLVLGNTETLGIHNASDTGRLAYKGNVSSDEAMLCATADQFAANTPGNALIFGTVYGY